MSCIRPVSQLQATVHQLPHFYSLAKLSLMEGCCHEDFHLQKMSIELIAYYS